MKLIYNAPRDIYFNLKFHIEEIAKGSMLDSAIIEIGLKDKSVKIYKENEITDEYSGDTYYSDEAVELSPEEMLFIAKKAKKAFDQYSCGPQYFSYKDRDAYHPFAEAYKRFVNLDKKQQKAMADENGWENVSAYEHYLKNYSTEDSCGRAKLFKKYLGETEEYWQNLQDEYNAMAKTIEDMVVKEMEGE